LNSGKKRLKTDVQALALKAIAECGRPTHGGILIHLLRGDVQYKFRPSHFFDHLLAGTVATQWANPVRTRGCSAAIANSAEAAILISARDNFGAPVVYRLVATSVARGKLA
jgi:hypothetical protein